MRDAKGRQTEQRPDLRISASLERSAQLLRTSIITNIKENGRDDKGARTKTRRREKITEKQEKRKQKELGEKEIKENDKK